MKRIRVKCPKCDHEFVAQKKVPKAMPIIPQKEWDNVWTAIDKLFKKIGANL